MMYLDQARASIRFSPVLIYPFFALFISTISTQNWENKECRQAIYDEAIRFWLDRSIDGFRIDTVV
jgi:hypothetical protein